MSAGSFCRSPSMVTMISPRACGDAGRHRGGLSVVAAELHQADARVGAAQSRPRSRAVPSRLPSSTNTISKDTPRGSTPAMIAACSGRTLSSSLKSGTTIERSGGISSRAIVALGGAVENHAEEVELREHLLGVGERAARGETLRGDQQEAVDARRERQDVIALPSGAACRGR